MVNPHVLILPYPVQGHVIPMMELAQSLAEHGFKITFVNTNASHERIVNALAERDVLGEYIHMVSISDGMETWEDRNAPGKLSEAMASVMPGKVEELIQEIIKSESDKITCMIADQSLSWAMEIGKKVGIKRAAFLPAAATLRILGFRIQQLIDDGIIDKDGNLLKHQMIQLSPSIPAMNTTDFVWLHTGSSTMQKIIFESMIRSNDGVKLADWLICNSTYNLEPDAFISSPEIIPIGPLLASHRLGYQAGHFWPEDSTCLKWLDQQPPNSVIYIAFGSLTIFNRTQFQELALGLELTNRPFLWVVRADFINAIEDAYPDGFIDRVGTRGQMVGWAPQQKVLSHPSVACFLSHCGWNSTMEGVSNGVPFLCWPYFADQFFNQRYICDVWKVGLGFQKDERGIITRGEIQNKVQQLLGHDIYRARALELKEATLRSVSEGGTSYKNFNNFIKWLKA
ncbi:UDP-glycosyltransferase 83A1-like [Actinidia eriantha]|uniref:UDP-glycosyltransferase 83A1-like n=1 Tax=Actinidia eriantha TaxID=165200 RepID=UPI00258AE75C|nr:UDP-glycosyltransferase 83A1-like [Actinidia eriantha]